MSVQANFNGVMCYNVFINFLAMGKNSKLTTFILDQKKPEKWAPLLDRERVMISSFYTPQESFQIEAFRLRFQERHLDNFNMITRLVSYLHHDRLFQKSKPFKSLSY